MTDTTFRTPSPVSSPAEPPKGNNSPTTQDSKIEVPYMDYETEHGKPYLVDYFNLGPRWQDDMGGFPTEVATIESYFQDQISRGELPNSIEAVKTAIKKIEKITNVPKEERTVMKVETLAHYVEFLMKCDKTKFNLRRYVNQ
jgi:hypothetical protein